MPNRKRTALIAAAIAGLLASPAFVQAANQDKPAANPTAAAETTPGGMPMHGNGMMGQGMMGQGMMGSGMMGSGMTSQGVGMMGARHVEGSIAFLRTELQITEAQQKLWDAVAAAMRTNATAMTAMRGGMMQTAGPPETLPDRLAAAENLLNARLDALHKYKAAVDPLYTALSDQQKKTADELMPGMMGMGMGGGMMNGEMMGRMGSR